MRVRNEFGVFRFQKHQNDLEKYGLSGQVKCITTKKYNNNKFVEGEYDWKHIMEFNEIGNVIEEKEITPSRCKQKIHRRIYRYNGKNFKTERIEIFADGAKVVESYQYDAYGNLREVHYSEQEADLERGQEFFEPELMDIAEIDREVLHYEDQNRVVEIDAYVGSKLGRKTLIAYNDKTLETMESQYQLGTSPALYRQYYFIYNDRGYKIYDELLDGQGAVVIYSKYKYNKHGDMVYSYSNDIPEAIESTKVFEYQYDYDKKQNWLRRYLLKEGSLVMDGSREISYYG